MNRYAVFSYIKDRSKGETVPVGVVAWSPESGWHRVRLIQPNEPPAGGLAPNEYLPFVILVQDKLAHWEETGQLPYSTGTPRPCEDEWWTHVRKLLNHEISLSEPRPLGGPPSGEILEALFRSVTGQPRSGERQETGVLANLPAATLSEKGVGPG